MCSRWPLPRIPLTSQHTCPLKQQPWRQSQDGGVGRHRVSISPQLGHLLATGQGLWRPRRREEPQSEPDLGSRAVGWAEAHVVEAQSPNNWTNREPQTPGNIHLREVSRSSSSQHQDPALPNSRQTPVLEASGQTASKTGTQSHS